MKAFSLSIKVIFILLAVLISAFVNAGDQVKANNQFKTIEWIELMPKKDLDALLNPPDYITDLPDGAEGDQISGQLDNKTAPEGDDPYQLALKSTNIVSEMDNQAVRIPGFIVPLEFDEDQVVTQFFLVPYFGACIHVPPPPPNQIILVNYPKGLELTHLYDPFWIRGVLSTTLTENSMAVSAYSLKMHDYEMYTE